MKYEIIKWRIKWHHIGEVIELDEEVGKAYWNKYLKALKEEKKTEWKEVKNASNKALTNDDATTKWQEKNS